MNMNEDEIYRHFGEGVSSAARFEYKVELQVQMFKYAVELEQITAKAFCEGTGLNTDLL